MAEKNMIAPPHNGLSYGKYYNGHSDFYPYSYRGLHRACLSHLTESAFAPVGYTHLLGLRQSGSTNSEQRLGYLPGHGAKYKMAVDIKAGPM